LDAFKGPSRRPGTTGTLPALLRTLGRQQLLSRPLATSDLYEASSPASVTAMCRLLTPGVQAPAPAPADAAPLDSTPACVTGSLVCMLGLDQGAVITQVPGIPASAHLCDATPRPRGSPTPTPAQQPATAGPASHPAVLAAGSSPSRPAVAKHRVSAASLKRAVCRALKSLGHSLRACFGAPATVV
jgi:hypothetical protein